MPGHEHHNCQRHAGVSIRVALQPERNEYDSQCQNLCAKNESIAGV
jgi:hypothetical protein